MLTNTRYKIIDAENDTLVDTLYSFEDVKNYLNASASDVASSILDKEKVNDKFYIKVLNFESSVKNSEFVSDEEKEEILRLLEEELEKYSLHVLADRIGISRTTFYRIVKTNRQMNKNVAEKIVEYLIVGKDRKNVSDREYNELITLVEEELKTKNISKVELAKRIGMTTETLYRFLNKQDNILYKTVEKIKNYFKTEDNNA